MINQINLFISAKFDVKNDMIIKTDESRKLGAKFLDNADSLSKIECLHLCCETESCDVFVYEEKVCNANYCFSYREVRSIGIGIAWQSIYVITMSCFFLFRRVKVNVICSIVGHLKISDANFPNIQIIRVQFYH